MRYFSVLLLLAFVALISAKPRKPTPAQPLALARSNSEALQKGLPLPRPASIPMRCPRENATCIEESRKPRRHRKRQNHPSATTIPSRTANYQQTCSNVRLSAGQDPTLLASCRTQTGETNPGASFHLSQCVSYGILGLLCDWKPFNPYTFESSCTGCRLEGTTLNCLCGFFRNTVDLAPCISNENGQLACRPPYGI